jgi:D-3-phosphoglycerate dehydrogenase
MPNTKIAFLDQFHPDIYTAIARNLPDGWEAVYATEKTFEARAVAIAEAEATFVFSTPVDEQILAVAPRLRLVQKLGAGYDNIDLEGCARRGIAVARLKGGNAIPVAEHTVMMILATYRRLPEIDRRMRTGEWMKEEGRGIHRQIHGRRVGLIGLGAVGKAVATALSGFGVEIVYYDPVTPDAETERALRVRLVGMDELIETSDIVSLHCPLDKETSGMMDEARIESMKQGAVLINCARGGLVDEVALGRALTEGRLFGAGLDTFGQEPPGDNPLFALDRTVFSSHLAGATLDNFTHVIERGMANAMSYLSGGDLPEQDVVKLPDNAPV